MPDYPRAVAPVHAGRGACIARVEVHERYPNGVVKHSPTLCGREGTLSGVPATSVYRKEWCGECLSIWRKGSTS